MKIPSRYFLGILTGVTAAFFLPPTEAIPQIMEKVVGIVLGMGRYVLLPLIFFSLPIAITRLRRIGAFRRLLSWSAFYAIATSLFLATIGALLPLLLRFERIPVAPGAMPPLEIPQLNSILLSILYPYHIGNVGQDGTFLLVLIVPAFLLGWHYFHDKEVVEPAYNVFDSLSRILYRANRYILTLMPFLLMILALYVTYSIRFLVDFTPFAPILASLLGVSLLLIFAVYPCIVWLLNGRQESPWPMFRDLFGVLLVSFVSASPIFNYGNLTYHLKEKLHIPRQSAALIAPLYLMFARGGTALVAASCMITVIRSYSSLEITFFQTAWTLLFSFLISFALPEKPDGGIVLALMMLGKFYGRGLEEGWLILVPILPFLAMIATLLDTATGTVFLVLVNKKITCPTSALSTKQNNINH